MAPIIESLVNERLFNSDLSRYSFVTRVLFSGYRHQSNAILTALFREAGERPSIGLDLIYVCMCMCMFMYVCQICVDTLNYMYDIYLASILLRTSTNTYL